MIILVKGEGNEKKSRLVNTAEDCEILDEFFLKNGIFVKKTQYQTQDGTAFWVWWSAMSGYPNMVDFDGEDFKKMGKVNEILEEKREIYNPEWEFGECYYCTSEVYDELDFAENAEEKNEDEIEEKRKMVKEFEEMIPESAEKKFEVWGKDSTYEIFKDEKGKYYFEIEFYENGARFIARGKMSFNDVVSLAKWAYLASFDADGLGYLYSIGIREI